MIWPLIFLVLLLCTVLLNAFAAIGDRIGTGLGDILNGALDLLFLIMAGVGAFIAARRARKRQS
jgi:hypothetical protein